MEARIGFEPMNKGFADLSPKITETQCLQGFRLGIIFSLCQECAKCSMYP
jgi:hypothetical protein